MKPSLACRTAAMLLLACAVGTATAHDAFFEPLPGGAYRVRFADDGKPLPYPPAKLTRAWGLDAAGGTIALQAKPTDGASTVTPPPQAELLVLEFTNGFFSRTTQGTVEKPMNEAPGAVSGVWAKKTGKYVVRWNARTAQPQNLELEIVPEATAAPRAGDVLTVRVLSGGQPVEGVKVSRGEHESGERTDAQGKATFKVAPGRNFVWTERRTRVAGDPRFDSLAVASNLVFHAP